MARLVEQRKDLLASMMRNGIYEAAVAVMTRYGMEGTTMDRVAEEAKVAKGSLYNYFPSKLDLLKFVHDKTVQPMEQRAQEILAEEMPALQKLESLIREWFEYLDKHRGLFNFLFNDQVARELLLDRKSSGHAKAVKDVATIVRQGIQEGTFRQLDPMRVAWLLFGAMREIVEGQLSNNETNPMINLTEEVLDFVLHGIGSGK